MQSNDFRTRRIFIYPSFLKASLTQDELFQEKGLLLLRIRTELKQTLMSYQELQWVRWGQRKHKITGSSSFFLNNVCPLEIIKNHNIPLN